MTETDPNVPGREPGDDDPLVREEERAAAEQAGTIGGPAPEYEGSEEDVPVQEGGGGVAEGFEESERELTEQASHGDAGSVPDSDRSRPEDEADRSTAVYGEPDEVDATEVTSDPREDDDDPGEGPGIAADR